MSLKTKLTSVAVDSARDYLQEKLEKVKQLDLNEDGKKDVDQISELVMRVAAKVKDSMESTDFPKLASGLEQVMSGASTIRSSVDRAKLADACTEIATGMKQLGNFLQLGVHEIKESKAEK
ncbi:MAG: hypothetical protein IT342_24170 [Candidatus Melainabacteria bacterium]|nr:hypothetical protein [Candidatus Melainabacteria bacterium]